MTGLIIEFFVNNRLTESLPILIIRNRLGEEKKIMKILSKCVNSKHFFYNIGITVMAQDVADLNDITLTMYVIDEDR